MNLCCACDMISSTHSASKHPIKLELLLHFPIVFVFRTKVMLRRVIASGRLCTRRFSTELIVPFNKSPHTATLHKILAFGVGVPLCAWASYDLYARREERRENTGRNLEALTPRRLESAAKAGSIIRVIEMENDFAVVYILIKNESGDIIEKGFRCELEYGMPGLEAMLKRTAANPTILRLEDYRDNTLQSPLALPAWLEFAVPIVNALSVFYVRLRAIPLNGTAPQFEGAVKRAFFSPRVIGTWIISRLLVDAMPFCSYRAGNMTRDELRERVIRDNAAFFKYCPTLAVVLIYCFNEPLRTTAKLYWAHLPDDEDILKLKQLKTSKGTPVGDAVEFKEISVSEYSTIMYTGGAGAQYSVESLKD